MLWLFPIDEKSSKSPSRDSTTLLEALMVKTFLPGPPSNSKKAQVSLSERADLINPPLTSAFPLSPIIRAVRIRGDCPRLNT